MTEEPITITFTDRVKKIARRPGADVYDVIFKRRAAFYSLEGAREDAAAVLTRSMKEDVPVLVICDAVNSALLEASVVE